jgi:hypothetical protein
MDKNGRKRLKPALLQMDTDCFIALREITGYAPANLRYNIHDLQETHRELDDLHRAEAEAAEAAAAARKNATAKEWEFHNLILGAKDQVVAQFGRDSDEAKAVGLKKKSEYKPRARRAATK